MSQTRSKPRRRAKPDLDPYLTPREVADHFGIAPRTVYEEIKAGRLPAYKLGPRTTRLRLSEVEAALEPVAAASA